MKNYSNFIGANKRWLAGGFLLTLFSSFGQTFFVSLSTSHVRAAFDLTSGEYGGLYMLATLSSAVVLTFFGRIVDYISIVFSTVVSTLLLALACVMFAQAQSIEFLVVALFGLRLFGQGMMTHIAMTAMGRWYAENRGKAVSMVSIGFNAGVAFFPIAFVTLVGAIGWHQAWYIAAAVMVLVAMPSIVLLLLVERSAISTLQSSEDAAHQQWTVGQMLKDPLFWGMIFWLLGPPFISTAIFFHQDFLFAERGWSLNLFAWSFVMLTLISIVSGLLSGIAIDRFSAVSLLPIFLIPLGIGCVALAVLQSSIALLLYMAFLGVTMGVNAAVFGSIWPEIYGTRNLGAIRSIITAMMVFSSALGPGIMGWAIDFGVAISSQFIAMSLFCFFGTFVLWECSKRYHRRAQA